METVRCPYCIEADNFKEMAGHLDGRYICGKCGHMVRLRDQDFRCACPKCRELNRSPMKTGDKAT